MPRVEQRPLKDAIVVLGIDEHRQALGARQPPAVSPWLRKRFLQHPSNGGDRANACQYAVTHRFRPYREGCGVVNAGTTWPQRAVRQRVSRIVSMVDPMAILYHANGTKPCRLMNAIAVRTTSMAARKAATKPTRTNPMFPGSRELQFL